MTEQSSSGPDNASPSTSPWSSDVPIPAAPVEFSWTSTGDSNVDSAAGVPPPPTGSQLGGPANPGIVSVASANDDADRRRRQRGLAGAGIGVVTLLAVGWLVFGRGGGGADPDVAADDSAPAETDSGDSLPTVDPVVTEPQPTATATGGGATSSEADGAEWRKDAVELPQILRDTAVPFDVVAVTSDGSYIEIQVPGGRVDLVDISRTGDGRVVAGETSTLYTNYNSTQNASLLRVGEPPTAVAVGASVDAGQLTAVAGGFAGFSYSNNGDMSLISIAADGSVVATDLADVELNVWQRRYAADGSAVISEAGGVYIERSPGEFERLSTGQMMFASRNYALVRDCDAAMACGYATINLATGERIEVSLGDQPSNSFGNYDYNSANISPDGRWLRYIAYGQSSVQEVLVDLTTGTRTELDNGDFGGMSAGGNVWAADSSGFFQSSGGGGLVFYELATGETVRFGEQFGRIVSFDVRTVQGRAVQSTSAAATTGLSLIALTEAGDVAQIDVDSGAVITTDGPERERSAGATIVTDSVGAIIVFSDASPPIRFRAEPNEVLEMEAESPGSPLWPGPVEFSVWAPGEGSGRIALELKDVNGGDLGERISLDAAGLNGVIGSDGRGGIVVESQLGGVFAVGAGNVAERITSGELLAINATVAYVRECDEALQCGVFVVDRTTGARSPLVGDAFDRVGNITRRAVPSGQNVSPDGAVAFVRDANDPARCLMVDTAADVQQWTGVPCVDVGSPIIWTADSSAAVWLNEGQVTVFERAERSVRLVNTVKLAAIGAVPVLTTSEAAEPAVPVEAAPPTTVPTE